eukprot:TRINITY_DN16614_c0_g1_i1.p2 TRINITY_DN16614_c0_g1~~TRINITY_DN16614_c0_g1_i1.p2  ORF type:complete len:235 (-),score=58.10 TRINITY_DN16614_c0_g1_i1:68-772(-)
MALVRKLISGACLALALLCGLGLPAPAAAAAAVAFLSAAPPAASADVGLDFDRLRTSVVGAESFQKQVMAACKDASDVPACRLQAENKTFCALLMRSHRELAAEHCDLPADIRFLAEKKKEAGVVSLSSGLMYKVIKRGTGSKHPVVSTPCLCHYRGSLVDGSEFDSSYSHGEPITFAPDEVIAAWTEALQLMVEGDEWQLFVPAELGYGSEGSGPIPGGATLVFDLTLLKVGA